MEKIWSHIFKNELKINPEEHNIILKEVINNPKYNKEKIAQIMFEKFKIKGLYIGNSGIFSSIYEGKTNSIICDSGDSITQIIPIYDGKIIQNCINKLYLGGNDIINYLIKLLNNIISLSSIQERDIGKDIKEKICYISFGPEIENNILKFLINYQIIQILILMNKVLKFLKLYLILNNII